MAEDALQIAIEHHRAGRLRQAEAGYRALLEQDPHNAEASHWLGVLACQAGRPGHAVVLLERAAAGRPGEACIWHNLGQAYLAAGRAGDAIQAFERAAAIEPDKAETQFGLGLAHLGRRSAGDAEAAVEAMCLAVAGGMDSAAVHYHLAVALLASGRADEAIAACRQALQREPEHAGAYCQMAMAHRCKGEVNEVRKCLLKAAELQPRLAQAWYGLAMLDAEAGRLEVAAALMRRAIKARPGYAAAYHGLGRVLQAAGKQREATAAFAQALQASRAGASAGGGRAAALPLTEAVARLEEQLADPHLADFHYVMAAQTDLFPPARVPTHYVEKLFDRYADHYDEHLRGALQYRGPEAIAEAVAALEAGRMMDVLDLGCGTGLCGPLLRPMADTLAGVDLSAAMIDKAREKGVYDALAVGDMVETMRQSPEAYDLLVSADVLIYVGDLSPTFEAAATALRPGGLLAFTVEAGEGERYQFQQDTRRFTHSREYLRRLAEMHGFVEESVTTIIGRMQAERPVVNYLVVLRKP